MKFVEGTEAFAPRSRGLSPRLPLAGVGSVEKSQTERFSRRSVNMKGCGKARKRNLR